MTCRSRCAAILCMAKARTQHKRLQDQWWAERCLAFQAKTHAVALLIMEALALALREAGVCDLPLEVCSSLVHEWGSCLACKLHKCLKVKQGGS